MAIKQKVAFLWITRNEGTDRDYAKHEKEPTREENVNFWESTGEVVYEDCEMWELFYPDLKLKPGEKLEIKRTSLKRGFKFEVVK